MKQTHFRRGGIRRTAKRIKQRGMPNGMPLFYGLVFGFYVCKEVMK